ncbi:unnamed protein product [Bursaphelenchus okinawaensis]|uniref:BZIP domain-containing protein n=1 Tax=Bursaphelenchus okinawaensis TaxID=465554 RepID=A0A811LNG5_9BILA|nr:unnamed protein product [Bursaphelenchus okinawaensis]CAG9126018.1 unnamed protein product [Bursaphelenchus okinawaensis]
MSGLEDCDVETYNNLFNSLDDELDFFTNDGFQNNVDLDPSEIDILNGCNWGYKCTPESSDSGNYSPGSSNDDITRYDGENAFVLPAESTGTFSPSSYSGLQAFSEKSYNSQLEVLPQNPCTSFQLHTSNCQVPTTPVPVQTIMLATPVTLVPANRLVVASPAGNKANYSNLSGWGAVNNNLINCGVNKNVDDNGFIKKIEDKRLRNRAAAQASRQRKRMEMDTMKQQLQDYEDECNRLKQENKVLKERVNQLENIINNPLRRTSDVPHKKAKRVAGACLAVCALLFTINNGYMEKPTISTELQLAPPSDLIYLKEHHGRSLPRVSFYNNVTRFDNQTLCNFGLLNTTEKIRLNKDINGWVKRHEQLNFVELRKGVEPVLIYNSPKSLIFKNATKQNTDDIVKKRVYSSKKVVKKAETNDGFLPSVLNVSHGADRDRDALMDKLTRLIKREDDVLYLVMMKDYFLLPNLSGNATQNPKLSIVIPALSQQEKGLELKMMKIDTEVTGTGLFYLSKDVASVLRQSEIP